MKRTLKAQILSVLVAVLLTQTAVIIVLTLLQKREMKADVLSRTSAASMEQADQLARGAWQMCDLISRQTNAALRSIRNIALGDLKDAGGLRIDGEVEYEITSAVTGEKRKARLPRIFLGQTPLVMDASPDVPSPFVDRIGRYEGLLFTFWQRINPEGDMVRLNTSWMSAPGQRGVGTYQTPSDPGWHDILTNACAGKEYTSIAVATGKPFYGLFVPVYANGDRTTPIGMLGMGMRREEVVSATTAALDSLEQGKHSYIGILRGGRGGLTDSKGQNAQGVAVLGRKDRQGYETGENLWNKEVDGEYPARKVVEAGLRSQDGKPVEVRYRWTTPDGVHQSKTARVVYFAPFDWCIFVSISDEDFKDISNEMDENIDQMLLFSLGGSLIVLVIAALMANYILRRIIRPLNSICNTLGTIATGDLVAARSALREESGNRQFSGVLEAEQLREAAGGMTASLLSLVTQSQRSSVQLVSSANQIRATSRTQESTMDEFGGHVSHVAAAIREISATAQELSRTMSVLKDNSAAAAGLATTGQGGLERMQKMLRQLAEQTRAITAKLALINEKTGNISMVVTTITKVAEQTNLLSLNAAIEAEKAGEYGLGFAVVAREIRHLADQTAVATLDIGRMVKETQASVAAGVMEMDRFAEDVRASVQTGGEVAGQLAEVIGRVQELTPQFEKVNEGMEMQSQGARQISESMTQLNDAARHLADSFREFNEAADGLRGAADAMQSEIERFKVN